MKSFAGSIFFNKKIYDAFQDVQSKLLLDREALFYTSPREELDQLIYFDKTFLSNDSYWHLQDNFVTDSYKTLDNIFQNIRNREIYDNHEYYIDVPTEFQVNTRYEIKYIPLFYFILFHFNESNISSHSIAIYNFYAFSRFKFNY